MPLRGTKIIELTGYAPVSFCGKILSDFGASVIRIDKPSKSPRSMVDVLGSGKRSIALNIKTKEGVEILQKILNQSDVLIESYRPGVIEKLGLGPDILCEANEKLIYARLTGFGQSGPFAKKAGHDINFVALSGLLSLLGRPGEKPVPPMNFTADFGGGSFTCALGIILALLERMKSAKGQVIDCSIVEGTSYMGSWVYHSKGISGPGGQPWQKTFLDCGKPFYDTYSTKDGKFIAVAALEPQFYKDLLEKLGLEEDDMPQYGDDQEARARLTAIFKEKTQEEWCAIFDNTDVCVTPVLSLESATTHRHNSARETFVKSKSEYAPSPAPKLSRTPGYIRSLEKPLPTSGENSIDILLECGFKRDEIHGFIEQGTVYQTDVSNKF